MRKQVHHLSPVSLACGSETHDQAKVGLAGGAPRVMLSEKQLMTLVPLSRSTIWRMEKKGTFPRSTYISPNKRLWFQDEIAAWQNAVDERDLNRGRGRNKPDRVLG